MRSYGQLCSVARALDIIGDRWNLLVVRELLIGGQARFTDLQNGLPGIAPNLLSQRLRDLEQHDVVRRDIATAPAAGTLYRLTERGRALEGTVRELMKWGAPTVPAAPDDAAFQMHWLSLPARFLLKDSRPDQPAVTVRFGDLSDGFDVTADGGSIDVEPARIDVEPAAAIGGPGLALVGLVQGAIALTDAPRAGIHVAGDRSALQRILPSQRASSRSPAVTPS